MIMFSRNCLHHELTYLGHLGSGLFVFLFWLRVTLNFGPEIDLYLALGLGLHGSGFVFEGSGGKRSNLCLIIIMLKIIFLIESIDNTKLNEDR